MSRRGRAWERRRATGAIAIPLLAMAGLSVVVASTPEPAGADVIDDFDIRFQTVDNGAIRLFGNEVLTCPASAGGCETARTGAGPNQNDNNYRMVYVDADGS